MAQRIKEGDPKLRDVTTTITEAGDIATAQNSDVVDDGKGVEDVVPEPHAERKSSQVLHDELLTLLKKKIVQKMPAYKNFITKLGKSTQNQDLGDILKDLEKRKIIGVGRYDVIIRALKQFKLDQVMKETEHKIKLIDEAMLVESRPIAPEIESPHMLQQQLYLHINEKLGEGVADRRLFLAMARICGVPKATTGVLHILRVMEDRAWICVGNYQLIIEILEMANLKRLKLEVEERQTKIVGAMKRGPRAATDISESQRRHCTMFGHLYSGLGKGMDQEYSSFQTIIRTCLPKGALALTDNVLDILDALESANWIAIGNYTNLIQILRYADLEELASAISKIQDGFGKDLKSPVEDIPDNLRRHYQLYAHVNRALTAGMEDYEQFLTMARGHIKDGEIHANKDNIVNILCLLESKGKIGVGKYELLIEFLKGVPLDKLAREIEEEGEQIHP